mmetsp:Transcript_15114/g.31145  ORF Transcript_15114/g.31145 Transcript_15114/m.31145 type:complete len:132 (-) Transcript_15114:1002-1397(-)
MPRPAKRHRCMPGRKTMPVWRVNSKNKANKNTNNPNGGPSKKSQRDCDFCRNSPCHWPTRLFFALAAARLEIMATFELSKQPSFLHHFGILLNWLTHHQYTDKSETISEREMLRIVHPNAFPAKRLYEQDG